LRVRCLWPLISNMLVYGDGIQSEGRGPEKLTLRHCIRRPVHSHPITVTCLRPSKGCGSISAGWGPQKPARPFGGVCLSTPRPGPQTSGHTWTLDGFWGMFPGPHSPGPNCTTLCNVAILAHSDFPLLSCGPSSPEALWRAEGPH
jgi:hypothetical protein